MEVDELLAAGGALGFLVGVFLFECVAFEGGDEIVLIGGVLKGEAFEVSWGELLALDMV